jgi:hypothetical protein
MIDDDDWINIDEDAPPRDPNSRRGILVVAATAANAKEMAVEERWFLRQTGLPCLVIFEETDGDGVSYVANVEAFRGHGYGGPDDPVVLEDWLASRPRDVEREEPVSRGNPRRT